MTSKTTEPRGDDEWLERRYKHGGEVIDLIRPKDTWHFDHHWQALRKSMGVVDDINDRKHIEAHKNMLRRVRINRRAWQLFRDWWRWSFTDEACTRRKKWDAAEAYEACLKTAKIVTILEQETPSPSSTDGPPSSNAPTKEPSSPKTP